MLTTATPIHDGMRTPMRDRAWNPYTPMSPPRFAVFFLLSSPQMIHVHILTNDIFELEWFLIQG